MSAVATVPGRLTAGNSLWVDSVYGSDASGSRGVASRPFKTLTAAKTAASSGDVIVVLPGTYTEQDLLKNGVNWHFFPGAIVRSTDSDSVDTPAFFDDRSSGACTCAISGKGIFYKTVSAITNLSYGCVYLSNASSDIKIECQELQIDGGYGGSIQAALLIKNCARLIVNADAITSKSFVLGSPSTNASGIYWEKGLCLVNARQVTADKYALWSNDNGGNPSTDIFLNADWIASNNGGSTLYHSGNGANGNFRSWITAKLVQNTGFTAVSVYTAGKFYLVAEKIEANSSSDAAVSILGAVKAWITVQKISSPLTFAKTDATFSGELYLTCQHYDDVSGTVGTAFNFGGTGTIFLQGGLCKVLNGRGIDQLSTAIIRATSIIIDTSNTNNATNTPIRVAGASGVIVDRCTLVCGALAKSITGTGAGKTVKNYGSKANIAVDAGNVTIQVDPIVPDANVA